MLAINQNFCFQIVNSKKKLEELTKNEMRGLIQPQDKEKDRIKVLDVFAKKREINHLDQMTQAV